MQVNSGMRVRFRRPLQNRTVEGTVDSIIFHHRRVYYLLDFGPDESMELCVDSMSDPGFLEVTASGLLIEVLP